MASINFGVWAENKPITATSLLPTGKRITPLATPGARFEPLNPELPDFPKFVAGQALSSSLSPDGRTLLILTSGFNRNKGADDKQIDAASEEYVFVYDVSSGAPRKTQVLKVPNSFAGLAFSQDRRRFYVSGGVDDNLHAFTLEGDKWQEAGEPIKLGHSSGLGLVPGKEPLTAGGVAISADGKTAVVANVYNDSISIVDLASRTVKDLDLRPGKLDSAQSGVPGGEYPFWLAAQGNDRVYVSSLRDREVVEVQIAGAGCH